MLKILKQHLKKIQDSNEAVKKRWLIGASAIMMIFVIGGWLIYFNHTIETAKNIENEITVSTSFWQVFKAGLIITGESIKEFANNLISDINNKFRSENVIIIEKP